MGELYEPFPRLPKNIRQIGERDKVLKLYLEDYVNTYLKRLQPVKGADLRVGLLLGSRENHEDMPFVFVDGALEMEIVAEEGEQVTFTEDAWKKAYREVEQMFPRRTVQGWFLCGGSGSSLSPFHYWKQHNQYFTGKNQLMYLNPGPDGEETVYITSADGFYRLKGYSVYYERNQLMQDYMIAKKAVPRAETGVNDRAIQDFRQKMEEHQAEAGRQGRTVGLLSGLCSVLAITVLAGGVAMFNNYRRLHEMESVIASVFPEGSVREGLRAGNGKESRESVEKESFPESEGYVVEEAAGMVYPTKAPETEAEEQDISGSKTAPEETASENGTEEAASAVPEYRVYTVEAGETLYGICFKLYQGLGPLEEICRVNFLEDQNNIYAGQKLLVP